MTSIPDQILSDFAAIDPQALWNEMNAARQAADWPRLARVAFTLRSYLDKGGRPPAIGNLAMKPLAEQITLARLACEVSLEWAARGGAP
jgi:hypothetical protein